MKLVKLPNDVWINPEHVTSIKVGDPENPEWDTSILIATTCPGRGIRVVYESREDAESALDGIADIIAFPNGEGMPKAGAIKRNGRPLPYNLLTISLAGRNIGSYPSVYDMIYDLMANGQCAKSGPRGYGSPSHKEALDRFAARIGHIKADIGKQEADEECLRQDEEFSRAQ